MMKSSVVLICPGQAFIDKSFNSRYKESPEFFVREK